MIQATLTMFDLSLRVDAQGTICVGRSRVTLDTVIEAYQRRTTPEVIARQFPAVTLTDVYGTIAYYLQRQSTLDEYLRARADESCRDTRAATGAPHRQIA